MLIQICVTSQNALGRLVCNSVWHVLFTFKLLSIVARLDYVSSGFKTRSGGTKFLTVSLSSADALLGTVSRHRMCARAYSRSQRRTPIWSTSCSDLMFHRSWNIACTVLQCHQFCFMVERTGVCKLKMLVALKFSVTDVCVVVLGLDRVIVYGTCGVGIDHWISVQWALCRSVSSLVKFVGWSACWAWRTLVHSTLPYFPFTERKKSHGGQQMMWQLWVWYFSELRQESASDILVGVHKTHQLVGRRHWRIEQKTLNSGHRVAIFYPIRLIG